MTGMSTVDWDKAANNGSLLTLRLRRAGERAREVFVPTGMTPREFAETIHGFDGYIVEGFGFGLDDEHPTDCAFCMHGEAGRHNYETLNGE